MKNLFIPYELAVIAKEKGFSEPCLAYWQDAGSLVACNTNAIEGEFFPYKTQRDDDSATAPLYQQIVDWFRETHKIDFNIIGGLITYSVKLTGRVESVYYFGSYYEALNKAIEQAFKLI